MKLVHEKTGKDLKVGEKVKTFRGESAVVLGWQEPLTTNSTGRITTNLGTHFPSVYGYKWVD